MTAQCAVCGVYVTQPLTLGREPACEGCFDAALELNQRSQWYCDETAGELVGAHPGHSYEWAK